MNLDRQVQRKPFPGTRFGHDSSSAHALRFNLKPGNHGIPSQSLTSSYRRYITENTPKEAQITEVMQ
jgi:hypothetical protein